MNEMPPAIARHIMELLMMAGKMGPYTIDPEGYAFEVVKPGEDYRDPEEFVAGLHAESTALVIAGLMNVYASLNLAKQL